MDISAIQPISSSLSQGATVADGFQTNVGGGVHGAVIERSAGGYRAYVVPSLPGVSAGGSSVTEAEANLSYLLNVLG
jgi:hypothetical protein